MPKNSSENREAGVEVQSGILCYIIRRYSMITLDDYIVDVLMRDLVGHDRRLVSFLVYLWVASEQRRGKDVQASYQQIAESIGVSKSSAQAAVGWLVKRKLLACTKATVTATPRYRALAPWQEHESRGRHRGNS